MTDFSLIDIARLLDGDFIIHEGQDVQAIPSLNLETIRARIRDVQTELDKMEIDYQKKLDDFRSQQETEIADIKSEYEGLTEELENLKIENDRLKGEVDALEDEIKDRHDDSDLIDEVYSKIEELANEYNVKIKIQRDDNVKYLIEGYTQGLIDNIYREIDKVEYDHECGRYNDVSDRIHDLKKYLK